jgi:amino acid transporter
MSQSQQLPAERTPVPGSLVLTEKRKLRRVLGRADIVLFTAAAIVSFDLIAYGASVGGQIVVWFIGSAILYLIPYAMISAELGSAFPLEGGPYEWAKMSFGRLPAAMTAVMYWLCNPIWVGGILTATAIAVLEAFVFHRTLSTGAAIAFGLAFIWATVVVAIIAFRYGKWIPNVGTILKIVIAVVFVALVIAYLAQKGQSVQISFGDMKPTITGFLLSVGFLAYVWGGFEVSANASEEIVDPQRDVPKMIGAAGGLSLVLYGLVILGTLLVIPPAELTNVEGFTDAFTRVITVLGSIEGWVAGVIAVLIFLTFFSGGAAWLEGADRTQAVAALDGSAPAWMGRFTSFGTPITVNILSGIVASIFFVGGFLFAEGNLANFFAVMLALAASTAVMSYFFVFPALVVLRRKYPDVKRPYRVPGGAVGAWVCVILTETVVVLTGITLLWPGLLDRLFGQPYDIMESWGVSRLFFEAVTLGSFAVILLIGVVFWLIGKRDRAKGLTGGAEAVRNVAAAPGAGPGIEVAGDVATETPGATS